MDITEILGWTFLIVVLVVCLVGIVLLERRSRRTSPFDVDGGGREVASSWQGGEFTHHVREYPDGGGHSGGHAHGGGSHADGGGHASGGGHGGH